MVRSILHDEAKGHLRLQSQRTIFSKKIQPLDMGAPCHTGVQGKSHSGWLARKNTTTYGQINLTSSSNPMKPSQTMITQVVAKKTMMGNMRQTWTTVSLTCDIPAKLLQLQRLKCYRAHAAPLNSFLAWVNRTVSQHPRLLPICSRDHIPEWVSQSGEDPLATPART
jgi:hypothetical protein